MSMDRSTLVAFLSLLFMLFVQACTGIWWASHITTIQEAHTVWIDNHQNQQKDYPVLVSDVNNLKDSTSKLINQMQLFLNELREMKEHNGK